MSRRVTIIEDDDDKKDSKPGFLDKLFETKDQRHDREVKEEGRDPFLAHLHRGRDSDD